MEPAIRVENLGKLYRVTGRGERANYATLRETVMHAAGAPLRWARQGFAPPDPAEDFWALKGVDFEVMPGEVVGIIGRNGAGKSTLLKILSRITKPTTGRVTLNGRVGSLLEVGTGFHPELTGRENVYLNGSILGMSRREIAKKFDEIVAFAEVERFLDTPVKRYSSGMYVRLAFAVAAHLEPEILIVDEVLAVGDAGFQQKCLDKMGTAARDGKTVLFVSHNMPVIRMLCRRACVLERGRVVYSGPSQDAILRMLPDSTHMLGQDLATRTDRRGLGNYRFSRISTAEHGGSGENILTGEPVRFVVEINRLAPGRTTKVDVAIVVRDNFGTCLTTLASHFIGCSPEIDAKTTRVQFCLDRLPLLAGRYRLDLWCGTANDEQDVLQDALIFDVNPGSFFTDVADYRLPRADRHGSIAVQYSCTTLSSLRSA